MPEILQLGFMVRAFAVGGIIGIACPLLGTFLVLRRLSLIAETLAHVALAGAAVGLLLDRFPTGFALAVAVVAALVVDRLQRSDRLSGDSALAVVLYSALAVTVVLVSLGRGFNVDLFSYLFGSIVTVGSADLWATAALGLAVLVTVWLLFPELVQSTFDPDLARTSGVNIARVNAILAVLTAVMVTLSMRLVGALLVGALIVFPVLASLQFGRSFRATLGIGAALGLLSVTVGLVISYYWNIAAGGAIVLVALSSLVVATLLRIGLRRAPPAPPSVAHSHDHG